MKRKQVFVRAVDESGKHGAADVLDLDDDSFRAFVVGMLFHVGLVTGIKDEVVKGEDIQLRTKPGFLFPRGE